VHVRGTDPIVFREIFLDVAVGLPGDSGGLALKLDQELFYLSSENYQKFAMQQIEEAMEQQKSQLADGERSLLESRTALSSRSAEFDALMVNLKGSLGDKGVVEHARIFAAEAKSHQRAAWGWLAASTRVTVTMVKFLVFE